MLNKKMNNAMVISMVILMTACNGGGSKGGPESNVVKSQLIDAPVQGVEYINPDGNRDITLADGSYYCTPGEQTQFFVGGINLGSIACVENAVVYPMDLLPQDGATKSTFDTTKAATKAALLLLTIDFERPEQYDNSGSNHGPASLYVSMESRSLLDSYNDSVFQLGNEAALSDLIQDIRCWNMKGPIIAAADGKVDGNGAITYTKAELATKLADCRATYSGDNAIYDPAFDLNAALAGAVIHMEYSVQAFSGITANQP